jgi:RNA polymerase sigma-70 factor (ECF subfamily)
MTEEQKLIQDILGGNREAFSELIDRYKRLVSHIVYKMIKPYEDRQDISQDVFVKVYQNLGNFNGDCKLSSWIGRISYNACLNHLGKKQAELWDDVSPELSIDTIPSSDGLLENEIELGDIAKRIRDEINLLPHPYNVIVTLFHLDDMTYQEIAEITGMPDGTVKSYLFRARKLLRERLDRKYKIEDWKQCGT